MINLRLYIAYVSVKLVPRYCCISHPYSAEEEDDRRATVGVYFLKFSVLVSSS